ncbi:hypothetical protein CJ030_MR3G009419 [Morella rubra]|uniref:Uncharacterized protein n=1 Tax=Morella rubra TaxID=262757 RepID=A0A6A1W5Z7_9ROSI|nr:hypothetical protein CJ030_MR3G009419 [Morella rubra]
MQPLALSPNEADIAKSGTQHSLFRRLLSLTPALSPSFPNKSTPQLLRTSSSPLTSLGTQLCNRAHKWRKAHSFSASPLSLLQLSLSFPWLSLAACRRVLTHSSMSRHPSNKPMPSSTSTLPSLSFPCPMKLAIICYCSQKHVRSRFFEK